MALITFYFVEFTSVLLHPPGQHSCIGFLLFDVKKQQYAAVIAVCILKITTTIYCFYTQTCFFDQQDAHLNPQLQLSGSSNNPPMSSVQTADARGRSQLQTLPEDQETDEFIDIKVALVLLPTYHKRTYICSVLFLKFNLKL